MKPRFVFVIALLAEMLLLPRNHASAQDQPQQQPPAAQPAKAQPSAQAAQPAPQAQPANSTAQAPRGGRGAGRGGGRGRGGPPPPLTLGLDNGFLDFDTPDFNLRLVKDSQTIAALQPKGADGFDFTPANRLQQRASDRYNHLGDLTLRLRTGDSGDWTDYATSAARKPVTALPATAPVLAAADLSPTLGADCPVHITRTWKLDNGKLALTFDITNTSDKPVEIGALGIPMIFNNILSSPVPNDRNYQMYETASFFDPAINEDGGYLQVTRLNGQNPALVVVPEGKTPFEAWRVITSDPMPRGNPNEGTFEWMAHSQAYADKEWRGVTEWNPPTLTTLAPGESRTYGVKFLLSPSIRDIEKTLTADNRPVAVGIPGYILPMDLDGKLFLNYPHKVASITSEPAGAIFADATAPAKGGWQDITLHGKTWGRARLLVTYDDGVQQSISYYITKPAAQAVADLGNFLFTKQWYVDANDPFGRSPSVMTYDRAKNQIVTQDARVWIAGLSDEGGAGSWLAAAMKESGQPKADEVVKFQQFVDGVLWGGIQYKDGDFQYGVKKSVFYHDPAALPDFPYNPQLNWGSWTSWNYNDASAVNRGYDYAHVVAAYWAMYHLARNNPGLVTNHPWDWYLNQAYETIVYLTSQNARGRYAVGYVDVGHMDGDAYLFVLRDLQREGWADKAADIEARMKARADIWSGRPYPFGSEMAWDSTGQEEVYAWMDYFNHPDKAKVTLDSILGYMPAVPHWGYNGNARRFWDFIYGGAPGGGSERQLHHYGSGLNAIPVLSAYRDNPGDFYLLRVGYGGAMGGLSNIDQEGFAGTAFHSFPQNMHWDTYSGDYGPNFFGVATNAATYVVNHPDFGWQAFGGNVKTDGDWVKVQPLDAFRQRVYIAPRGLWLTLDAGTFDSVEINTKTHAVRAALSPATQFTPQARLRIEQPAKIEGVGAYHPAATFTNERAAFTIPLADKPTWVELTDAAN